MNKKLIAELAETAVHQTQSMMIMEYQNFESVLYENFAKLIIRECLNECDVVIDQHTKDLGNSNAYAVGAMNARNEIVDHFLDEDDEV